MTDTLVGGYFDGMPTPSFSPGQGVIRLLVPVGDRDVLRRVTDPRPVAWQQPQEEIYVRQQVAARYPHPCVKWIYVDKQCEVMMRQGLKIDAYMAGIVMESDRDFKFEFRTDERYLARVLNRVAELPRPEW